MLFNSLEFLFVFLPVSLAIYLLVERFARQWIVVPLILVSLFFYGYAELRNVPIILGSIAVNFLIGRAMFSWRHRSAAQGVLFASGVVANLALLFYFKYVNFFIGTVAGSAFAMPPRAEHIVLPLAISFFTFQQISFLLDVRKGVCHEVGFLRYAAVVLFFPHLLAGPILKYSELLPQFSARSDNGRSGRVLLYDLLVGLAYVSLGLFKKVIIADKLAEIVDPTFEHMDAGRDPTLIIAWATAISFAFQIYFDFSAYSDIAIGLGRFFGYRLPVNFLSPFKATNIVDFWQRWHISLTRFFNTTLYTPISLFLYRSLAGGERRPVIEFLALIAMPVLLTFALIGLWHGAGWNFVVFGLFQAVLIVLYRLLLACGIRFPKGRLFSVLGVVFTFLYFSVSLVYFRAVDMHIANRMLENMFDLSHLMLPSALLGLFDPLLPLLKALNVQFGELPNWQGANAVVPIITAGFVAFALPNLPQVFALGIDGYNVPRGRSRSAALRLVSVAALFFANGLLLLQHEPAFIGKVSTLWTVLLAGLACFMVLVFPIDDRSVRWRPNVSWALLVVACLILSCATIFVGRGNAFVYFAF